MARTRKGRETKSQRAYTKIIGEGLTEKYYSAKVKEAFHTDWQVKNNAFRESSPKALYELAKEQLDLGHTVYCLVDKDKTRDDQNAIEYIKKLEDLENEYELFTLCATMPCIEYWFLIHFKETPRHFANDKAVISELKKHISKYEKTGKYLNTKDLDAHLLKAPAYTELKQAIEYAKKNTNGDSHTSMYKLFKDIGLD